MDRSKIELSDTIIEGKCPKDGVEDKLIIIKVDGRNVSAKSDGKGDAYRIYWDEFSDTVLTKCLPENKYNPNDYEFVRFFTSFNL